MDALSDVLLEVRLKGGIFPHAEVTHERSLCCTRGSDQGARFELSFGIAASEARPRFRPRSIRRWVSGEPTLSGSVAFV